MTYNINLIRNFSIIAHIDHGKSTASDRIIEICGGLEKREMQEQVLDSLDVERERGITIKSQTVRLNYTAKDGKIYILNLMDTPGHVDFGYEVSRCLYACEGSVLLVDATQGVQAQTIANTYKALESNNEIIPVLNKIDLPSANVKEAISQIENVIGIPVEEEIAISGKTGQNIDVLLEAIIKKVPHPKSDIQKPTKILLIDAWYDQYLGVVLLVKIVDGKIKTGDKIKMLSNDVKYIIDKTGVFTPKKIAKEELFAGEIGFITANIKKVNDCNIGDTFVLEKDIETKALPGFQKIKPVVYCGIYPIDNADYLKLKDSIEKLHLNDSSIFYEGESSNALGLGFRCGFLGLLHLDVVVQRMTDEFDLDLVTTAPSVTYKVKLRNGDMLEIDNPAKMPDPNHIELIEEPISLVTIMTQNEYVGDIINLCIKKRGKQIDSNFVGQTVVMKYEIPMAEIIFDFHDKIKSLSRGYASYDAEFLKYEKSDTVKVSILLNGDNVEALSFLIDKSASETRGRALCSKLKEVIPRQMFEIPIQAAIGAKIIARETISAYRKDVTAKCYGGDQSRKMKLRDKQKKGKAKMKSIGSVDIPQEAFLSILKLDN